MKWTGLNDLRESYLKFFESKGHLRMASAPLVPQGDNSVLLINAGMTPLKKYFQGIEEPPRHRVTTCQKCIRTPDIDNVGKTARHGTYFEMLGNFSFGDYFKHEATAWAWEYLTKVLEIPEDRLWVTIYEQDDEAGDIWANEVGVPRDRIIKLGKADNFWEHGSGPCGPCSEIHFDRGEKYGPFESFEQAGECDRIIEIWNLVFTQFDNDGKGNYTQLATKNIDTGMGLERLACVMQDVDNLFEVDTIQNIMKKICSVAGVNYHDDPTTDVSIRVITDHIRSTTFMVGDGIRPSNEGRGYVLRRLLRRAARHGKLLGINKQFLFEVADTVIDCSKGAYQELEEKRDYIRNIIKKEEERFDATIDNGLNVLNGYIEAAQKEGRKELTGKEAFKLHDTYGFPVDLTIEMAEEKGLEVDVDGFNKAMQEQKDTARDARTEGSSWDGNETFEFENAEPTVFVGYDTLETDAKVVGIVVEDEGVCDTIIENQKGFIVTDKTPFYAEMGGQVGDIGTITINGKAANVVNTTKTEDGYYLHETEVQLTPIKVGDTVTMSVDKVHRTDVCRNHTATHILDKALRDVLGSHVAQAGSLVESDRLRFDFSHFEAMTTEQIKQAEAIVNEKILESIDVTVQELPIEEAKKLGAIALFGEKYGDVVRVVSVGDYSVEFCGGTHLTNTAQCGLFKIISESGVAAGVRRIEAVTGKGVLEYINNSDRLIEKTAAALKINQINEIDHKAESVMAQCRELEKAVDSFKEKMAAAKANNIMTGIKHIGEISLITAQVDGMGADEMKSMADKIKAEVPNSVAVMGAETDGKITFVAMASKEAVKLGVHCGKIIKDITAVAGGRGGGKPDMAQGGGSDASKIDDALAKVDEIVAEQIK